MGSGRTDSIKSIIEADDQMKKSMAIATQTLQILAQSKDNIADYLNK